MQTGPTIYTTTGCGGCFMTKRHLQERGLKFTEIDVATTPGARGALNELGFNKLPVVVTDDESWQEYRPDKLDGLVEKSRNCGV